MLLANGLRLDGRPAGPPREAGGWLLPGLVGLYARQSEASGPLGLAAFLVAFAGTALVFGTWWTNAFVAPVLAQENSRLLEKGPTG